jgi:Glycosyltransferase family 92
MAMLMEYIPTKSHDVNCKIAHLIWRCNLSPYIFKTHIGQLTHIRVSVYTRKNEFHDNASLPLLTVDVPVETSTVGYAGRRPLVKSSQEPSFIETVAQAGPIGVILCLAGVRRNAMWYLPEWIQHHLNVGVDHIFIGVDTRDVLPYLEEKLVYYIERGNAGWDVKIKSWRSLKSERYASTSSFCIMPRACQNIWLI